MPAAPPCPCGLPVPYDACCGRYHAGSLRLLAPTPEALMRSRYAAFVLADEPYLLDTWHPTTRPLGIEPHPTGWKWLGLEVRRAALQDEDHGIVEFVARSKLGGRAQRLHERSRFVREEGRWFYVDGDLHSP